MENRLTWRDRQELLTVILSCLSVYCVIWAFTGAWPWTHNIYNSYWLQAKAWLSGHTDLGRNYEHLELAFYNGKYYVSFPPFPSVILLPFVLLNISDLFASLLVSITAAAYVWRLCKRCAVQNAVFWTLFLVIGSNVLLVGINAWVWFFAQNLSFLLTVMSLCYAVEKKRVRSLTCWALAIGCRPFQIIYLPLLLLILTDKPARMVRWLTIPALVGLSYMLYNYIRFDSVWEFGHNYLPEFLEAEKGQFSGSYVAENLKSLIRLPEVSAGVLHFPRFNGMSVFLCFPILIFTVVYTLRRLGDKRVWVGLVVAAVHILLITTHKTMGGFHFGNRYFVDIMPCLFYITLLSVPKGNNSGTLAFPAFLFGLGLNLTGIIQMLTGS